MKCIPYYKILIFGFHMIFNMSTGLFWDSKIYDVFCFFTLILDKFIRVIFSTIIWISNEISLKINCNYHWGTYFIVFIQCCYHIKTHSIHVSWAQSKNFRMLQSIQAWMDIQNLWEMQLFSTWYKKIRCSVLSLEF